jgi:hypothetical protein
MSDVLYSEPCRTDPDCEIRIKKAAWNDKYGTNDVSAKFTWFDVNGNPTRGGEVSLPRESDIASVSDAAAPRKRGEGQQASGGLRASRGC